MLEGIGVALVNHVKIGFRRGQEPGGASWARLKYRSGRPLLDTRQLANSFTSKVSGDEVKIGTNVCYAPVHQYGATIKAPVAAGKSSLCGYVTKGSPYLRFRVGGTVSKPEYAHAKRVDIPARPFVPENGLSSEWAEDVVDNIERHFELND